MAPLTQDIRIPCFIQTAEDSCDLTVICLMFMKGY